MNQTAKGILGFFPSDKKPRDIQIQVLTKLEEMWSTHDVFVISMPTGTGKSYTAMTIARWASQQAFGKKKTGRDIKGAMILVPNNMLVDQYKRDFPAVATLKRKDSYSCHNLTRKGAVDSNCAEHSKYLGYFCTNCPYKAALIKAQTFAYGVYNHHTIMAYKLHRPVMIADEAHTLIARVQEANAHTLWDHEYHVPDKVRTYGDLDVWVSKELLTRPGDSKLNIIKGLLQSAGKPTYVVQRTEDLYRGALRGCLKLLPVDTSQMQNPILRSSTSKIVLLSATIGKSDVEQLGLANKRVAWIDVSSPIEAENRPVYFQPVTNVSQSTLNSDVPLLAARILDVADFHQGQKGLIHAPYKLAALLQPLLVHNRRFIFHDNVNKKQMFQLFKDKPPEEGPILVASGMYEGIDLPYEQGRWQVVAKVPWPSLVEPAIRYRVEECPEWYSWEAGKIVMQASGRVCRGADDYGITYIIDGTMRRLIESGTFPQWFKEALQ